MFKTGIFRYRPMWVSTCLYMLIMYPNGNLNILVHDHTWPPLAGGSKKGSRKTHFLTTFWPLLVQNASYGTRSDVSKSGQKVPFLVIFGPPDVQKWPFLDTFLDPYFRYHPMWVIMSPYGSSIYWVWVGPVRRGQKGGPEMTPFWVIWGSKNDPKKGHFWTPSWNIPGASPLILLKRGLRRGVQKWVILGYPHGVGQHDSSLNHR